MQAQKLPATKSNRQRKFLLVLPVIILPFMTFLLWSTGVIGSTETRAQGRIGGLNTQVPDANLKSEKTLDKMSIYRQADKDSAKYREAMKSDPYFGSRMADTMKDFSYIRKGAHASSYDPSPYGGEADTDPNEERVTKKLAELNKVLNEPVDNPKRELQQKAINLSPGNAFTGSADVDRLENMLHMIKQKDSSADPEMQQLNSVMEKLLDIQHPERVEEKLKKQSEENRKLVYPVTMEKEDNISLLQNSPLKFTLDTAKPVDSISQSIESSNQFYSLDEFIIPTDMKTVLTASIAETQTIVSGAAVKMLLTTDVYISGMLIPKETFVYGKASLSGERLQVNVTGIRYGNNILPVSLFVYDLDGMQGIDIPGAITRDVMKQSGDEAVRSIGMTSLDPSIGAQVAGAGIEAAKNLAGKKIKLVKVTVREGYQVLLKDSNDKQ